MESVRNMHKVAVIGDRESVLGFRAIGFDVSEAESKDEAEAAIKSFAGRSYAVIFITEQLAELAWEQIDRFKEEQIPAIITLPNNRGSTGIGMQGIKKVVERAVGADIFGGE